MEGKRHKSYIIKLILFKMAIGLLVSCSVSSEETDYSGIRYVSEHGYDNCIELTNDRIRVVLEPNVGGRVLIYALKGNNVQKVLTSPVCAIIAYDMQFYKRMPELFPHDPGKMQMFIDDPKRCADDAFRNGSLQGAYFMIAARALGFDVGPISGFDNSVVDKEFFTGTTIKSNFLCNVGYGDEASVWQKLPRPAFDTICQII